MHKKKIGKWDIYHKNNNISQKYYNIKSIYKSDFWFLESFEKNIIVTGEDKWTSPYKYIRGYFYLK